ncbi:MAG TPA: sugar ABC transporter ATP-binding protein [Ruminococcus sp.]|nr:sugar ABC transporter ATP-binding protein [Ruminococcus sp.]
MDAIKVNDIHKHFRVYSDKGKTFKEKVIFHKRNRYQIHNVLNGISFDIPKGQAVGLIGHNGCGKSTLLKLMTRIIYPDSGSIEINGRVSSLIELGAGFHPDMSGRENIYTNASIFGLNKKEIDERLDRIIEFSGLEEFIDNPVRTYSSGMYTRLAFSVAINVDADVLLIDEILAVGDTAFQAKCLEKLRDIKAEGTTIVIVSHSLAQIEELCERSIWIDGGKIKMDGSPNEVHPEYMEYMGMKASVKKTETVTVSHEKVAEITAVRMTCEDGSVKNNFRSGEKTVLEFDYRCIPEKTDGLLIGLMLIRNDKLTCYGTNTKRERINQIPLKESGTIRLEIEKLNLVAGTYWFDIALRSRDMFAYDYKEKAVTFTVYSDVKEIGIAKLDHKWKFD